MSPSHFSLLWLPRSSTRSSLICNRGVWHSLYPPIPSFSTFPFVFTYICFLYRSARGLVLLNCATRPDLYPFPVHRCHPARTTDLHEHKLEQPPLTARKHWLSARIRRRNLHSPPSPQFITSHGVSRWARACAAGCCWDGHQGLQRARQTDIYSTYRI